jgi:hypothetical protein
VVVDGREAGVRWSCDVATGQLLRQHGSGARCGPYLGPVGLGHVASIRVLPAGRGSSSARAGAWCCDCHLRVLLHSAVEVVSTFFVVVRQDDGVGTCSSALKNKGGGPRVPTCAKTKICRLSAPIDLARVSCSGRLHRQTPLDDSCLDIARSGGIRSCVPVFFSNRLVFKGALRSSARC